MTHAAPSSSLDVAFSPAVKAVQEARGSREAYRRVEAKGGWPDRVTDDLRSVLAEANSVYLATASADGQPYVQHRGGPPGFVRVLDDRTLGFADFAGNRQYITTGNLAENPRAFLFVMDYLNRRRFKIWGRARTVDPDPELAEKLGVEGYRARVEQAILFEVEAWDANCPQHIPRKIPAETVAAMTARLNARIAALEEALAVHEGGGAAWAEA